MESGHPRTHRRAAATDAKRPSLFRAVVHGFPNDGHANPERAEPLCAAPYIATRVPNESRRIPRGDDGLCTIRIHALCAIAQEMRMYKERTFSSDLLQVVLCCGRLESGSAEPRSTAWHAIPEGSRVAVPTNVRAPVTDGSRRPGTTAEGPKTRHAQGRNGGGRSRARTGLGIPCFQGLFDNQASVDCIG